MAVIPVQGARRREARLTALLSGFWEMLEGLSATGCDGLPQRPRRFVRGRINGRHHRQKACNDRRAVDGPRSFTAPSAKSFEPFSASRFRHRQRSHPDLLHRTEQRWLLGRARSPGKDWRHLPVQGLRTLVCEERESLNGMCNDIFA